jgi:hypothetical protein
LPSSGIRQDQHFRLSELEEAHKHQVEEFERRWADPSHLVQFNKPSPEYLVLRTTESNLFKSKQLQRAQMVKAEADALEQQETLAAQARAVAAMRAEYEILAAKQKRELDCFHEFTTRVSDVIEKDREGALQPLHRLSDRLTAVVSARTPRVRKNQFATPPAPPTPRAIPGFLSGRPLQPRTLGIGGIQVRQFIKVRRNGKPDNSNFL